MTQPMSAPKPYYVAKGRGCDDILRCYSCQKLITAQSIAKLGCCTCGSTKVKEVTTLTPQERADIVSGVIVFADSDLFLAEFEEKTDV